MTLLYICCLSFIICIEFSVCVRAGTFSNSKPDWCDKEGSTCDVNNPDACSCDISMMNDGALKCLFVDELKGYKCILKNENEMHGIFKTTTPSPPVTTTNPPSTSEEMPTTSSKEMPHKLPTKGKDVQFPAEKRPAKAKGTHSKKRKSSSVKRKRKRKKNRNRKNKESQKN